MNHAWFYTKYPYTCSAECNPISKKKRVFLIHAPFIVDKIESLFRRSVIKKNIATKRKIRACYLSWITLEIDIWCKQSLFEGILGAWSDNTCWDISWTSNELFFYLKSYERNTSSAGQFSFSFFRNLPHVSETKKCILKYNNFILRWSDFETIKTLNLLINFFFLFFVCDPCCFLSLDLFWIYYDRSILYIWIELGEIDG